jgi:uncharacterized protein YraI
MRKIFLFTFLWLVACTSPGNPAIKVTPTLTPLPFATATLAPTFTPRPSATFSPPTVAPTITPIIGLVTTQINVRTSPDKNARSLGLLNYGNRVQVIGKDKSGDWLQIIYPENSTTQGWVALTFVQIAEADLEKIPEVISQDSSPPTQSPDQNTTSQPTTLPVTPSPAAHTAKVKNQINVRNGPGQTFSSLGLLEPSTMVTLTGQSQNGMWAQILYEAGPEGKGWVAATYLEGATLNGLPYFDGQGNLLSAGTPAASSGQTTLTPTAFSPAAADGDSAQKPAVQITFSPDATGEFTYSSDLSSPDGDSTDWVAFTPYEPTNQSTYIYSKLECNGNGGITATLQDNGVAVAGQKPLVCGNYDVAMKVLGGKEYILVLNADGSAGALRFTHYKVFLKAAR